MYIKCSLKCKVINELINVKPHIESIFEKNKKLIIVNIYTPSNSNLEHFICDIILILAILATKPDDINVNIEEDLNVNLLQLN